MSQTSLFVLLHASCHKKREYIWFMGGNFRGFQGNELFLSNEKDGGGGGACAGTPGRGTSPSVLLNVSYHKKGSYLWLRQGSR